MRTRGYLVGCLLLLGSCSGSPNQGGERPDGVLAALADPERVELLALHPYPYQLEGGEDGLELFHEYGVLGRAELEDGVGGNELLALIEQGIEESNGMVAACFNPRHGLRVAADGSTWELLICYECLSMQVYRDGERVEGHRTAESVEPQVSATYRAAGLEIHRNDGD